MQQSAAYSMSMTANLSALLPRRTHPEQPARPLNLLDVLCWRGSRPGATRCAWHRQQRRWSRRRTHGTTPPALLRPLDRGPRKTHTRINTCITPYKGLHVHSSTVRGFGRDNGPAARLQRLSADARYAIAPSRLSEPLRRDRAQCGAQCSQAQSQYCARNPGWWATCPFTVQKLNQAAHGKVQAAPPTPKRASVALLSLGRVSRWPLPQHGNCCTGLQSQYLRDGTARTVHAWEAVRHRNIARASCCSGQLAMATDTLSLSAT
jgi:hypothetical protein